MCHIKEAVCAILGRGSLYLQRAQAVCGLVLGRIDTLELIADLGLPHRQPVVDERLV